jgi:hypothetical protein
LDLKLVLIKIKCQIHLFITELERKKKIKLSQNKKLHKDILISKTILTEKTNLETQPISLETQPISSESQLKKHRNFHIHNLKIQFLNLLIDHNQLLRIKLQVLKLDIIKRENLIIIKDYKKHLIMC